MDEPFIVWQVDAVACVLIHSADAGSYEVQIREHGQVIARRWFDDPAAAAAFADESARAFGVSTGDALPH
jgi:hypothetical protein